MYVYIQVMYNIESSQNKAAGNEPAMSFSVHVALFEQQSYSYTVYGSRICSLYHTVGLSLIEVLVGRRSSST